ncbi:hypothetical protein EYF80_015020 [Liparis tanakae]|uniref:Uncharacterized protein n=1 Tax=Liparis tanakae TaxID=230148 RepID=A0A4Z2IBB6_9TELE|nr:hypothetical protein EYF80_015020 [Liparis tanakae]
MTGIKNNYTGTENLLADGVEAELLSEAAPVAVRRLIEAAEKHGLNESLYRVPPASGGPAELRQALDSGTYASNII